MRFTIVVAAAALLLVPAVQASAGITGAAKARPADFPAAKKKNSHKRKAEKIEYMRAVPAK